MRSGALKRGFASARAKARATPPERERTRRDQRRGTQRAGARERRGA